MLRLVIFVLIFLYTIPAFSFDYDFKGTVDYVFDGDTISVKSKGKKIRIRLYGVDCPESKQTDGDLAKKFTQDFVSGKTVYVKTMDKDKYGRIVGIILCEKRILNSELVKNGYAFVFRFFCTQSFCNDWIKMEEQAQKKRIGIWAGSNVIPPWEYRKRYK